MRISDWSSDVCSSDLALLVEVERVEEGRIRRPARALAEDEGRREGLERADQLHDEVEEDDRRQHGQGDADELQPRPRTVDGGRGIGGAWGRGIVCQDVEVSVVAGQVKNKKTSQ